MKRWRLSATLTLKEMATTTSRFYEQVYAVVRRIPRGRVTSYGRVAKMLGRPNAARAVGYALAALGSKREDRPPVPWHRVINSVGRISTPDMDGSANLQAQLLRAEGVAVTEDLRVDLRVYLWDGLHLIEIDDILAGRA
ncbi:MAG TPA: methylated-DNA--[protein]-cysteine S-methyltransferase [Promineifilum sp.]